MEKQEFDGILTDAGNGGVFVAIPFNTSKVYGQKGLIKIKATIDGEVYRGSLAPMLGPGKHCLIVLKSIREKIGKKPGDSVRISLEKDTEERVVTVPADFQKALKATPTADKIFSNFAYSHRKEYVRWIEEAKRIETRASRIEKAVEMISAGKKYS